MNVTAETIEQKVHAITNEAVATGQHNLRSLVASIGKQLSGVEPHTHGAILSQLQVEFQHRQTLMQNAMENWKHSEQLKQAAAAEKAQAAAKEQAAQQQAQNKARLETAPGPVAVPVQ